MKTPPTSCHIPSLTDLDRFSNEDIVTLGLPETELTYGDDVPFEFPSERWHDFFSFAPDFDNNAFESAGPIAPSTHGDLPIESNHAEESDKILTHLLQVERQHGAERCGQDYFHGGADKSLVNSCDGLGSLDDKNEGSQQGDDRVPPQCPHIESSAEYSNFPVVSQPHTEFRDEPLSSIENPTPSRQCRKVQNRKHRIPCTRCRELELECDKKDDCKSCGLLAQPCSYRPSRAKAKAGGARNDTKKRSYISVAAKTELSHLFDLNPYPSNVDLEGISRRTGITTKAAKTWFNNARARRRPPRRNNQKFSANTSPEIGGSNLLDPRDELIMNPAPTPNDTQESPRKSQTENRDTISHTSSPERTFSPLERYLSAPPEDEPVSVSAIQAARANMDSALTKHSPWELIQATTEARAPGWKFGDAKSQASLAGSIMTGPLSPDAAVADVKAYVECGAAVAIFQHVRHPGAHCASRPERAVAVSGHVIVPSCLALQTQSAICCDATFSSQYEWARHEETLHYPRKKWVCRLTEDHTLESLASYKDPKQLSLHSCTIPEEQRSFFRKDHLMQHIKQVHRVTKSDVDPAWGEEWCVNLQDLPAGSSYLYCGFCGGTLESWEARKEHIILNHLLARSAKRCTPILPPLLFPIPPVWYTPAGF
ncbi:hypothetical protein BCR34DRAFT_656495 [Clohesyomyces aquaticus]|uniref:Homeobox domain-containing protein n=1 Tax=Clohesyomyces aquaticus TaxID=1231657 RepID=A0A1Y1ZHC6_9PLEO|nr:hypothetical protein BCR34DRAFT_656495 [Clohesyomyces aquaticus]